MHLYTSVCPRINTILYIITNHAWVIWSVQIFLTHTNNSFRWLYLRDSPSDRNCSGWFSASMMLCVLLPPLTLLQTHQTPTATSSLLAAPCPLPHLDCRTAEQNRGAHDTKLLNQHEQMWESTARRPQTKVTGRKANGPMCDKSLSDLARWRHRDSLDGSSMATGMAGTNKRWLE